MRTWTPKGLLLLLGLSLAGCVSSVRVLQPPEGSTQTSPVPFEVEFHADANTSTWQALVDGQDRTADFTVAGNRATASLGNLAAGQHTFEAIARFQNPPSGFVLVRDLNARSTFTVTGPPALSFSPAQVQVPLTTTRNVTVNLPSATQAALTVQLSVSSNAVSLNNQPPGQGTSLPFAPGQSSQTLTLGAYQPGSATVTATAPGLAAGALGVTVPVPGFSQQVTPSERRVPWGQSASYTVEVRADPGFNQAVDLSTTGLPVGAAASFAQDPLPVTPGGSATTTLTVSTTAAGTVPGRTRFRVEGSAAGRTERGEATLDVGRTEGAFPPAIAPPFRTSSTTCGPVTATVTGTAVRFQAPTGNTQNRGFSAGYVLTPQCRTAVLIPPPGAGGQQFVNLHNLGFPVNINAPNASNSYNFPSVAQQVWTSPDESLVAIIGPAGAGTARDFSLVLHDVVEQDSNAPSFFDGTVTGMTLSGDEVTVTGMDGMQPFSFDVPVP